MVITDSPDLSLCVQYRINYEENNSLDGIVLSMEAGE